MEALDAAVTVEGDDRMVDAAGQRRPLHLPVVACYLACAIGGYVACPVIPTHVPEIIDAMLTLVRPGLVVRRAPALEPDLPVPEAGDIRVALAGGDSFAIMPTSGTTREPKGIRHSLQGMIDSARAFAALSGKLRITGRSKDIIVRGGINVAPILIENALGRVRGVEEVAAVGVPDDFWGEIIVACVIPEPGIDAAGLERDILRYATTVLDGNLRPDRVVIMTGFPRAGTGKVQKHILKAELAGGTAPS